MSPFRPLPQISDSSGLYGPFPAPSPTQPNSFQNSNYSPLPYNVAKNSFPASQNGRTFQPLLNRPAPRTQISDSSGLYPSPIAPTQPYSFQKGGVVGGNLEGRGGGNIGTAYPPNPKYKISPLVSSSSEVVNRWGVFDPFVNGGRNKVYYGSGETLAGQRSTSDFGDKSTNDFYQPNAFVPTDSKSDESNYSPNSFFVKDLGEEEHDKPNSFVSKEVAATPNSFVIKDDTPDDKDKPNSFFIKADENDDKDKPNSFVVKADDTDEKPNSFVVKADTDGKDTPNSFVVKADANDKGKANSFFVVQKSAIDKPHPFFVEKSVEGPSIITVQKVSLLPTVLTEVSKSTMGPSTFVVKAVVDTPNTFEVTDEDRDDPADRISTFDPFATMDKEHASSKFSNFDPFQDVGESAPIAEKFSSFDPFQDVGDTAPSSEKFSSFDPFEDVGDSGPSTEKFSSFDPFQDISSPPSSSKATSLPPESASLSASFNPFAHVPDAQELVKAVLSPAATNRLAAHQYLGDGDEQKDSSQFNPYEDLGDGGPPEISTKDVEDHSPANYDASTTDKFSDFNPFSDVGAPGPDVTKFSNFDPFQDVGAVGPTTEMFSSFDPFEDVGDAAPSSEKFSQFDPFADLSDDTPDTANYDASTTDKFSDFNPFSDVGAPGPDVAKFSSFDPFQDVGSSGPTAEKFSSFDPFEDVGEAPPSSQKFSTFDPFDDLSTPPAATSEAAAVPARKFSYHSTEDSDQPMSQFFRDTSKAVQKQKSTNSGQWDLISSTTSPNVDPDLAEKFQQFSSGKSIVAEVAQKYGLSSNPTATIASPSHPSDHSLPFTRNSQELHDYDTSLQQPNDFLSTTSKYMSNSNHKLWTGADVSKFHHVLKAGSGPTVSVKALDVAATDGLVVQHQPVKNTVTSKMASDKIVGQYGAVATFLHLIPPPHSEKDLLVPSTKFFTKKSDVSKAITAHSKAISTTVSNNPDHPQWLPIATFYMSGDPHLAPVQKAISDSSVKSWLKAIDIVNRMEDNTRQALLSLPSVHESAHKYNLDSNDVFTHDSMDMNSASQKEYQPNVFAKALFDPDVKITDDDDIDYEDYNPLVQEKKLNLGSAESMKLSIETEAAPEDMKAVVTRKYVNNVHSKATTPIEFKMSTSQFSDPHSERFFSPSSTKLIQNPGSCKIQLDFPHSSCSDVQKRLLDFFNFWTQGNSPCVSGKATQSLCAYSQLSSSSQSLSVVSTDAENLKATLQYQFQNSGSGCSVSASTPVSPGAAAGHAYCTLFTAIYRSNLENTKGFDLDSSSCPSDEGSHVQTHCHNYL
eukprot:CAMPEP_0174275298 /NCGR_PEP_ID=MMETSP0439-20130205/59749_1 /TAXON_ID=0 /ORGANISM="Stereomyxa ramosa, Strain Chinc5" /LENGTH=1302 /DNA_ID=CAMNT_0015367389 /DNA_START=813 /DNA_END=4722 /DNA_ORIENTATION=-